MGVRARRGLAPSSGLSGLSALASANGTRAGGTTGFSAGPSVAVSFQYADPQYTRLSRFSVIRSAFTQPPPAPHPRRTTSRQSNVVEAHTTLSHENACESYRNSRTQRNGDTTEVIHGKAVRF